MTPCHHVKAKCGFCGPICAAGGRLHPYSSFASILFDLLAFHGEIQVPQRKVVYVSTPHQQFVYLVSKMLSHIALPNRDAFCIVL